MKQKRQAFRRWAAAALLVLLGLLADSSLRLVTTEYTLTYASLPEAFSGIRIVQLSDLHGAEFGRENRRLLRAVADAAPDLIAITGDLADGETDLDRTEPLLEGLTALAPVFYVSGNHEWSDGQLRALKPILERCGVRYLQNDAVLLERGDASILVAGVEDPNGPADMETPEALLARLRTQYPRQFLLLLGHRNDFPDRHPTLPAELILCGHAHGGVIRLPVLGGLLGTDRKLFPTYSAGLYHTRTYDLLVSRGLGNTAPVPRLFNPPEIVCVTLNGQQ